MKFTVKNTLIGFGCAIILICCLSFLVIGGIFFVALNANPHSNSPLRDSVARQSLPANFLLYEHKVDCSEYSANLKLDKFSIYVPSAWSSRDCSSQNLEQYFTASNSNTGHGVELGWYNEQGHVNELDKLAEMDKLIDTAGKKLSIKITNNNHNEIKIDGYKFTKGDYSATFNTLNLVYRVVVVPNPNGSPDGLIFGYFVVSEQNVSDILAELDKPESDFNVMLKSIRF